ncbi:hypothetical protein [Actinokineospora inagensis]|uniref:hypothetical protein n=1 Tax=Actinokineospora inagensis TaxID=103730 RepID=UPI0003F79C88|nr:hypothetical protein [Actinokineospora inagensis]
MSSRSAVIRYFRRTEGKLNLVMAVAIAAALLAGMIGVLSVRARADLLADMADRQSVINNAEGEIYRSLADADATAFAVVLVSGEQVAVEQQTFRADIAVVSSALVYVARVIPDVPTVSTIDGLIAPENRAGLGQRQLTAPERLYVVAALLPTYASLVEAGWSNSTRDGPLGTSYLNDASQLVGTLMAIAGGMREAGSPASVDSFPWFAVAVGLAVVLLLVALQAWLSGRTRRRFNIGMVAATVLTAGAFAWLAVASLMAAGDAAAAAESGARLAQLTEVRANAGTLGGARARALIFPLTDDRNNLKGKVDTIRSELDDVRETWPDSGSRAALDVVDQVVARWQCDIKTVSTYRDTANSITAKTDLVPNLDSVIATTSTEVEDSTRRARDALVGVDIGMAMVMALAGAAVVVGLRPRIAEYR